MARNRYVVFRGECVDKQFPDAPLQVEFEKSQRFWQLWQDHPIAQCPQPLSCDEHQQRIRFSYLPADSSLATEYVHYLQGKADADSFFPLLDDVANVLACLHQNLKLLTRTPWSAPQTFRDAASFAGISQAFDLAATPQAFMHCDFGFANVYFQRIEGRAQPSVVLYDPSPNRHSTFSADQFGSIYIDLGCLFASLNGRFPLRKHATVRWRLMQAAKQRFLRAYEAASGHAIDDDLVEAVGYATAFASFTRTYGPSWRRQIAMNLLYNRFKYNVSWMEAFHEPVDRARRAS